jgi:phage antirepressor YoqD-like protein
LTAYFKLGEDIGSRDGRDKRLKVMDEKHEKLLQFLLNSAYLRHRKSTGCQYRNQHMENATTQS